MIQPKKDQNVQKTHFFAKSFNLYWNIFQEGHLSCHSASRAFSYARYALATLSSITKLTSVCYASVLLLIMNFVIGTLSK